MEYKESQQYIQILIQTLIKQRSALQEVLQITQMQSELAKAEEFNEQAFEETLNKKEILIAKLNEADDGFVSVYGRVKGQVQGNPEAYRGELKEIQSLIKECTDIGVEIKVLEDRNREKLVSCFSAKNKQYSMRQNAATVASKYNRFMRNGVKNIDLEIK